MAPLSLTTAFLASTNASLGIEKLTLANVMVTYEDSALFKAAKASGRVIVTDHPKLDLDSYIANYKGKTRVDRLYHIGITSTYLSYDALNAALSEAKKGKDIELYRKVVNALKDLVPNDPISEIDPEWEEWTKKQIKAESDRLEVELKGYKNNLIKESIRMGHDDLGQHYHSVGDLSNAAKAYNGMRQYCINPAHNSIMLLHLIHVNVNQQNWLGVLSNAAKLRSLQQGDAELRQAAGKVSIAVGLAEMASGSYKNAAMSFLETDAHILQARLNDPDDEDAYNEIMTPNDVAIYGGLCALASMDRKQLLSDVLENSQFRSFLELEPQIRRAIAMFTSSKYSLCLSILEASRTDLLLDVHLYRHVTELFFQIRSKAIVQYFIPYSCVTIASLATTFHVSEPQMEAELIDMIQSGKLDAKIDLEFRTLHEDPVDERQQVLEEAIRAGKEFVHESWKRILFMEILHAGLDGRDEHPKAERKLMQGSGRVLGTGDLMDTGDQGGSFGGSGSTKAEAPKHKESKKTRGFWA